MSARTIGLITGVLGPIVIMVILAEILFAASNIGVH